MNKIKVLLGKRKENGIGQVIKNVYSPPPLTMIDFFWTLKFEFPRIIL